MQQRHPWVTFLLPFFVYMVVGSFEPSRPEESAAAADRLAVAQAGSPEDVTDDDASAGTATDDLPAANDLPAAENAATAPRREPIPREEDNWFGLRYEHYPLVYTLKIVLTIAAIVYVLPGYRQFPFGISPLAIGVGVGGVVLWIALCRLGLEARLLSQLGLDKLLGLGERPAYNPLDALATTPAWAYGFLAIRFVGLALVVPIVEELFLRGFLMRFVVSDRWWEWPFGVVTPQAVVVGTLFPMLMHPGELLAAAVWFSLVTWLMVRTKNIWDCVVAHAVTNLLLGIYVAVQGEWHLW